jgi:hypothetical protein
MKNPTPYIYPGCMHMHTVYSDGTGTVLDVAAAANKAGLNWVIVSDHDSLGGKEFEGWHNDVLVLVAHEITPLHSHYMALNIDRVVRKNQPPQAFIDEVYAAGGFGIMLHPDDHEEDRSQAIHAWDDWNITGPSQRAGHTMGVELWNVMSDWRSKRRTHDRSELVDKPAMALTGPTTAVLAWWDRLNMEGQRTFGVGGLDAHATRSRHPTRGDTVLLFPYEWMFNTVTNYVMLDEPLSSDLDQARQQIYGALTQGHSYLLNRLDGTAPTPPLVARRGDEVWHAGDSPSLAAGPVNLAVDAGTEANVRLIANGQIAHTATQATEWTIDQPGIYRLEGYRNGRPWLYTNPLYVGA